MAIGTPYFSEYELEQLFNDAYSRNAWHSYTREPAAGIWVYVRLVELERRLDDSRRTIVRRRYERARPGGFVSSLQETRLGSPTHGEGALGAVVGDEHSTGELRVCQGDVWRECAAVQRNGRFLDWWCSPAA